MMFFGLNGVDIQPLETSSGQNILSVLYTNDSFINPRLLRFSENLRLH